MLSPAETNAVPAKKTKAIGMKSFILISKSFLWERRSYASRREDKRLKKEKAYNFKTVLRIRVGGSREVWIISKTLFEHS